MVQCTAQLTSQHCSGAGRAGASRHKARAGCRPLNTSWHMTAALPLAPARDVPQGPAPRRSAPRCPRPGDSRVSTQLVSQNIENTSHATSRSTRNNYFPPAGGPTTECPAARPTHVLLKCITNPRSTGCWVGRGRRCPKLPDISRLNIWPLKFSTDDTRSQKSEGKTTQGK